MSKGEKIMTNQEAAVILENLLYRGAINRGRANGKTTTITLLEEALFKAIYILRNTPDNNENEVI